MTAFMDLPYKALLHLNFGTIINISPFLHKSFQDREN